MSRITIPGVLVITALLTIGPPAPHSVQAQDNLPSLGRSTTLSEMDERRMGRRFIRHARQSMPIVDDPQLTQYITRLGNDIASYSDEPGSEFSFYLIRQDTLNAFAVPGGHIAVNSGLIMATESEAELASVVAHEVAHVTQQHLARMLEQSSGQGLKMLGALAAAILLGGQAGQAAMTAAQASAIENRLAYSRSFEREADGIGLRILARAGYDPRAMPAFFERLLQWSRIYDTGAPEFLRTHPLTTNRIADSKSRADNFPRVENPDQSEFHHIRAKMRALFPDNAKATVAEFASNLESGEHDSETAERYGYALALGKAGRHDEAIQVIDRLIEEYPPDAHPESARHRTARANLLMEAGRYDQSLEQFERLHESYPDDLAIGLYYAQALVRSENFQDAKRVLRKLQSRHKEDPRIYSLLARAEGEMGNSLVSHQHLAEYYYYRHNLTEAKRQLRLAKKYAENNDYAEQSIEARVRSIQRDMEIYEYEEEN